MYYNQPGYAQPMMSQPMMPMDPMGMGMQQPYMIPQVNPNDPAILSSPYLQECPPGMQFLIPTSAIIVRQQVELLELFTSIESNNRYDVLDVNGLRMYIAAETSDFFSRQCMGADRLFNITVLDNLGRPCLYVNRTQSSMCFNCGGNEVQIMTADNFLVGIITQIDCLNPRFSLRDDMGAERLQISGPCCCAICGDVRFVVEENGAPIGEVHKQWGGYIMESYTKADTFGVSFPVNLHPRLKCLLLGAVFLLDFMYFEQPTNHQRHHHHHGFHRHHHY